jgi:hypothetical protein
MLNVRSRVGVVAVTTGAAVLLALPVVAAGQVPGVDQVVGGVTETAENLVPAPVAAPAPPPAPLPAPAPAPRPAAQPAPAPAAPAAPAPAAPQPKATSTTGSTSSGSASGRGSERRGAMASSSAKRAHSARDRRAASGVKATAAQDDGGSPTDVEIADQAVEAPEDASPSTLPFTGLQLLLMGMVGLAAIASGGVLRRASR